MSTAAPAADLERRKKVRIRIRRDLNIAPQKYEGRTYYVVKDPVSMRYFRFKEQEHFLIRLMDGTQTLDDAQKAYEKRFRPERLTLEDLEQFAQQLLNAGLAQNESPQAGKQLFDQRKKRKRSQLMQALTNILYIKIPIFDPDKILERMLRYTRWMFTTWFLLLSIGVMLAAVMLVATHFEVFREKLPDYHEFFSFKTVFYLWFALGVVKIIHEFGHGLSCKAFGGEVHEIGALFLVFSPCMYCNVSDAWTLPNKWKRIIISAAGIYVELIIAAIATFVWWNTPSQPFINNMSLSLMVVCSVSTVVFNANPLMRYDGYYVLADLLEIPNLRDRSNRFLQRLVMEHCLGIEVQPEPYMALWRRILFVAYAVVSYFYRWIITFSILWFMSQWLAPYKLGVVSGMLALGAAGSMIGWPLYRMGKNLNKRGRLPDMKRARVIMSATAVGAVLVFLFTVPLPVSRVRQLALVQVQEDAQRKVYVRVPGILEKLPVKDGQLVEEGDILAEFRSLELENQLQESLTQLTIREGQEQVLNQQIQEGSRDPGELAKLRQERARLIGERDQYRELTEVYKTMKQQLVLRAPRGGRVMTCPQVDEIGKYFEKGESTPFCTIGDPSRLRALTPVPPDDYHLLRGDRDELRKKGQDLGVTLRVHGRGGDTWQGRVAHLEESEAKQVPVQLTNKGAGNIAVRPTSEPGTFVPQAQYYLVYVDFLRPDDAVCPGTMAQVKIHCKWRTTAWWGWRAFSSAFDLGMEWTDLLPRFLRPRS
jgi:putative peptide zinc metalloprotease protein